MFIKFDLILLQSRSVGNRVKDELENNGLLASIGNNQSMWDSPYTRC